MTKFTWSKFNGEFLSNVIYSKKTNMDLKPMALTSDVDMLVPYIVGISEFPTKEFVIKYRTEIELYLLKHHPEIVLEMTGAPKRSNYRTELNVLERSKMTNSLVDVYIKALCKIGGDEFLSEEYSEFTNVRTVDLQKSKAERPVSLYDFQEKAVAALQKHFIDNDKKSGLLVMPTGSGKTRTSVAFLLQDMVSKGYQIIWLTHRHMLIDQTADTFYKNSPVITLSNSTKKQFKMVCVSGNHKTIKATEKDDDLMILSIQSTCRRLDYLKTVLARKVVIVVDEAHHTYAKSYRKTIDFILKHRKDAKLLGLTATPIRGSDSESSYLLKLFGNKIIYSISMSQLITKGVLAQPVFEDVETGENFEATLSLDEKDYIRKWGELPESLVDKVSKSSERNELILKQYLNNKEKYGKTLIFAVNGFHAFTLCEEFKKHGIKCDFVYTTHGKDDNAAVIRGFKNNKIDVLININILTEGSDIPDIQTVFLTRPTSSEVLLMQMIGRGMRGISAGGTEKVNIVDFCDKWDTFNKWLNPKWVIDMQSDVEPEEKECTEYKKPFLIPWGMVKDVYDSLTWKGGKLNAQVSLPYGWYNILNNDEDYQLLVFKNQFDGYEKLYSDRKIIAKSGTPSVSALKKLYFGGFILPPKEEDLAIYWNNINGNDEKPSFFLLEDREYIEPHKVADDIKRNKRYLYDYTQEIFENYPIAKQIYGSLQKYNDVVSSIINYGTVAISENVIEEIPLELIPFTIDKPHNLEELTKEVIDEMFDGSYEGISSISWSIKPMKRYYGMYRYIDNSIEINSILNSSKVDKEVIKYVIYHELLHRDYYYHDSTFRALEHKYPNYTEWERFLDFKIGEYKLDW